MEVDCASETNLDLRLETVLRSAGFKHARDIAICRTKSVGNKQCVGRVGAYCARAVVCSTLDKPYLISLSMSRWSSFITV